MRPRTAAVAAALWVGGAWACPNECSFKGKCNEYNQCECLSGRTGADCSRRLCPLGSAWASVPTAGSDRGHELAECSAAGVCDRSSGECKCFSNFVGESCQRLACPASSRGVECSGHGKCMSMEHYAGTNPNRKTFVYGIDGLSSSLHHQAHLYDEVWDASKIHGCVCDEPWEGYDCGHRTCPRGDDPLTTGQHDEVQLIECRTQYQSQTLRLHGDEAMTSGTFALRYGPTDTTRPMRFDVWGDNKTAYLATDKSEPYFNTSMRDELTALASVTGTVDVRRVGENKPPYILYQWNVTLDESSDQYEIVPVYKQAEVQTGICAADIGYVGVSFAGEAEKVLLWSATREQLKMAIETFSVVDEVKVEYSAFDATGVDELCTPGGSGNVITVTFLRTRLDVALKGDLPALAATPKDLHRNSVDGQVSSLTPTFSEAVKGVDTCRVDEVQTIYCQATGGYLNLSLPVTVSQRTTGGGGGEGQQHIRHGAGPKGGGGGGTLLEVMLPFDASAGTVEAEIERLFGVVDVTVTYSEGHEQLCVPTTFPDLDMTSIPSAASVAATASAAVISRLPTTAETKSLNLVTITFHALAEAYAKGADGAGDVPELTLQPSHLYHHSAKMLVPLPTATEAVKGVMCEPLSAPYNNVKPPDDSTDVHDHHSHNTNTAQLSYGPVVGLAKLPPAPPAGPHNWGGRHPHEQVRSTDQMSVALHNPERDGGRFAVSYLGHTSASIHSTASSTEVEQALLALPSLHGVSVGFSGSNTQACSSPPNVIRVTFTHDFGDLPPLELDTHAMPNLTTAEPGEMKTTTHALLAVHEGGATDSIGLYHSRNGTKENEVCSFHGHCTYTLGVCDCFKYSDHSFASSNGRGGPGDRGDCGYEVSPTGDPMSEWHVDGVTTITTYSEAQQHQQTQTYGLGFSSSDCPGEIACSGHGHCSGPPSYRCKCADGWDVAGDCSERRCPSAPAWFDHPSEDNSAHREPTECSSMGTCDRGSGECVCLAGFVGQACEFNACPGLERFEGAGNNDRGVQCSGHGRCLDMRQLAHVAASPAPQAGEAVDWTYGEDPNDPMTWDAGRLRGCYCDEDYQQGGYTGADCSERTCAFGDDPNTSDDVAEVQVLSCAATYGTVALTFRSVVEEGGTRIPATTAQIPYNASTDMVKAALEALDTVGEVSVAYSATAKTSDWALCTAGVGDNLVTITFVDTAGKDLPPIRALNGSLVLAVHNGVVQPYDHNSAVRGTVTVAAGGAEIVGTHTTIKSVKGTREFIECSGRGLCDRVSGVCNCFYGYASSDGLGNRGTRGDCGYRVKDKLLVNPDAEVAQSAASARSAAAKAAGDAASTTTTLTTTEGTTTATAKDYFDSLTTATAKGTSPNALSKFGTASTAMLQWLYNKGGEAHVSTVSNIAPEDLFQDLDDELGLRRLRAGAAAGVGPQGTGGAGGGGGEGGADVDGEPGASGLLGRLRRMLRR